jgi:hypothetical protein
MLLRRVHNKPLSTRKTSFIKSIPPTVHIIPKDEILPDFLTNYIEICNLPDFAKPYANKIDCVQHLFIPTSDMQQQILDALQALNEKINIQEIKPYLMYFMVNDDMETANQLLMAYQQYYQAMDYILSTLKDIGSG